MKRAPSITSAEMRAEVMKAEVEQVLDPSSCFKIFIFRVQMRWKRFGNLKSLSQMDQLKIFIFSGTTEARHG